MRCDIVMATWNQVPMTRAALASLRQAGYPYRLILVDNSDDPEARRAFRAIAAAAEYGETLLLENERNVGWLKATNRGLEHADGDYVCLLNNDVVCAPGWLQRCIGLLEARPEIGLVNPRGNERRENAGVADVKDHAARLAASQAGLWTELDHCSGFCLVMPRALLQRTGFLDEIYEGGHYEDDDLSRRAQALGYRCAQCDDAFVLHLGSQSFRAVPDERRRLIERNREIHRRRWGTVRRLLVSVPAPGVAAERLIALIRSSRVYLVRSRHVPAEVLAFRHAHLTVLENRWLWPSLYFRAMALYLAAKGRIDAAERILPD